MRATVEQAASNPESDESLREAAQENSQRAVTGRHREGVEAARAGQIAAVEPLGAGMIGVRVVELAEGETLIPGLVDTHVHVNEPGRTAWEGFATATRAATAGVTTMVDMPLNSVPATVNVPALGYERLFAAQNAFVDIGFRGGAVPGNKEDLRPRTMTACTTSSASCCTPWGVDEFPHLEADEMEEVLEENVERTRWTGARSHILHPSSSDAIPMIRSAKNDGLDITVETRPHYLTLLAEEIPDGATRATWWTPSD